MAAFVQPGFVVAIIHDGKIIREQKDNDQRTVHLPFGSEYLVRIWNKTDTRAYARVLIDGTEVLSGKLILGPKEKVDLERFCIDGDLEKGKRFKFVEAGHGDVQDPTSKDNGMLEVIFEQEDTITEALLASIARPRGWGSTGGGILRGMSFNSELLFSSPGAATNCSLPIGEPVEMVGGACAGEVGATIEGSQSSQGFQMTNTAFRTFAPVPVRIRMRGPKVKEKIFVGPIEQPAVYGSGQVGPTWEYNGQVAGGLRYCGKPLKDIHSVRIDGEGVHITIPLSQMTFRS